MARTIRKLASEYRTFCYDNEFKCKIDPDHLGANIFFEHNGRIMKGSYVFSKDNNRYDAGAILHTAKPNEISRISKKILQSEHTRGMTERITRNGKVVGLTSRDGLRDVSAATLHSFFLDDIARWAEMSDKIIMLFMKKR